jgi:hypothetical protein
VKQETVLGFVGMDTEANPALRPVPLLQKDEGSNHEREGVWVPRRGCTHANVTKKASAVSALVGFQTNAGDYVLLVAAGTDLYSEAAFDE